jgi:hypothetical protein
MFLGYNTQKRINMLNKILIIVALVGSIWAKQTVLKYDVSFGIFSDIGTITSYFDENANTYKIKAVVATSGLASSLSGGLVERYESYGNIIDGILVPTKYIKQEKTKNKHKIRTYTFDHINKVVYYHRNGKKKVKYSFYTQNDLLTLFINSSETIRNSPKGKLLKFKAVGSSKDDGLITVQKRDDGKFAVVINQDIFNSKKGELVVDIDRTGIWKKAVLKDVMMYGDIKAKIRK